MTFLTIREAAEKTGHSPHKIRRLIKAIADHPGHADRTAIEPTTDDVAQLTAAGVQFTWRVSEELVRRELGEAATAAADKSASPPGTGESPEWLTLMQRLTEAKERAEERLFEQLRVKDDQIRAKDEQIAELTSRLKESHFLMQGLQNQLPEAVVAIPKPAADLNVASKVKTRTQRRRSWLKAVFR